jgi:DNA repair protein RadA/Sms
MAGCGLLAVPDPSMLFLSDRRPGTAGSVVVPTIEGQRPLLVEVQALVATSSLSQPRRSAQGFEHGRLALLLAVLERRVGLSVAADDAYVSVLGGVRLNDPGADLAVCLAVASARLDWPLATDLVVCGEVGLGGELRQVAQTPRRLAEAARLGFTRAIVPCSGPESVDGITVERVETIAEAIVLAGLAGSARAGVS